IGLPVSPMTFTRGAPPTICKVRSGKDCAKELFGIALKVKTKRVRRANGILNKAFTGVWGGLVAVLGHSNSTSQNVQDPSAQTQVRPRPDFYGQAENQSLIRYASKNKTRCASPHRVCS